MLERRSSFGPSIDPPASTKNIDAFESRIGSPPVAQVGLATPERESERHPTSDKVRALADVPPRLCGRASRCFWRPLSGARPGEAGSRSEGKVRMRRLSLIIAIGLVVLGTVTPRTQT